MPLSAYAKSALSRFDTELNSLHRTSHHSKYEYSNAVRVFIDICRNDVFPSPEDVAQWAISRGWDEHEAHDLGEVGNVVFHTLRELGHDVKEA